MENVAEGVRRKPLSEAVNKPLSALAYLKANRSLTAAYQQLRVQNAEQRREISLLQQENERLRRVIADLEIASDEERIELIARRRIVKKLAQMKLIAVRTRQYLQKSVNDFDSLVRAIEPGVVQEGEDQGPSELRSFSTVVTQPALCAVEESPARIWIRSNEEAVRDSDNNLPRNDMRYFGKTPNIGSRKNRRRSMFEPNVPFSNGAIKEEGSDSEVQCEWQETGSEDCRSPVEQHGEYEQSAEDVELPKENKKNAEHHLFEVEDEREEGKEAAADSASPNKVTPIIGSLLVSRAESAGDRRKAAPERRSAKRAQTTNGRKKKTRKIETVGDETPRRKLMPERSSAPSTSEPCSSRETSFESDVHSELSATGRRKRAAALKITNLKEPSLSKKMRNPF